MRRETVGVTESLLDNAKREFLEYGFHDASLRRISAVSGVSTNSIYTRFGDKAGLFEAIVKDAVDGLMNIYLEGIGKVADAPDMEYVITEGTELVIEYIYQHKSEFELIFCKSAGTEYETYFDRLAAIEETYYKAFARQFSKENHKVDDFFIMYIAGPDGSMSMSLSRTVRRMRRQKNTWRMSVSLILQAGRQFLKERRGK